MAVSDATRGTCCGTGNAMRARIAERNHETKVLFNTLESFWVMHRPRRDHPHQRCTHQRRRQRHGRVHRQAGVAHVAILGAGYFISRGLAKSGSYEPDADYNMVDLSERKGKGDARD